MSGRNLEEALDTIVPTGAITGERMQAELLRVLEPGDTIGRYVVLGRVGAGGMGIVYSAYDPDLDRKIALKLLRDATPPGAERKAETRLLNEAQAMARLNHPNVVTVHDVGTFEGQVFIAMEHVDGVPLSRWRKQAARSWREVVDVMLRAGAGLAAAHAAGLVHRDIKPDNIMIGADERVRVMDFGLARVGRGTSSADVDEVASRSGMLAVDMTIGGSMPGTPAYMAPEQHVGGRGDAASDQFSFCVTLYELLYGERPFATGSAAEAAYSITQGDILPATAKTRVPTWLRRALLRGLAREPEHRWPDMQALLTALKSDPSRKRRRWIAAASVLCVGVLALGFVALDEHRRAARCEAAAATIDDTWGPAAQAELREAFVRSGRPDADDATRRIAAWLDPWADAWRAARRDACLGSDGSEASALAVTCLEDKQVGLAKQLEVWGEADAAALDEAIVTATNPPPLEHCTDPDWLARFGRTDSSDPALRASVRDDLARVSALRRGRRSAEAQALAAEVVTRAEPLGEELVVAHAWQLRGATTMDVGDFAAGEADLRRAFGLYTRLGFDYQAAVVACELFGAHGVDRADFEFAAVWDEIARAMMARTGESDGMLMVTYLNHASGVEWRRGDLDTAVARAERGLELSIGIAGEQHPISANLLNSLGLIARARQEPEVALAYLERSRAALEVSFGPDHPRVAPILNNIGAVYLTLHRFAEAAEMFERTKAILESRHGPDSPEIAQALGNLGEAWLELGRVDDAIPLLSRALEVREKREPAEFLLLLKFTLARALRAGGRDRERARALAEVVRDELATAQDPQGQKLHARVVAWLAEDERG